MRLEESKRVDMIAYLGVGKKLTDHDLSWLVALVRSEAARADMAENEKAIAWDEVDRLNGELSVVRKEGVPT